MIDSWLTYSEINPGSYGFFRVVDVSEIKPADAAVIEHLGKEILSSYRNLDQLKFSYQTSPKDELVKYIENYVFPSEAYQIVKNVKQGDFAEFLSSLIVSYFQGLTVPIHKMRWKFNKDRSVFCTDMMAHNSGLKITDLYYYEIKSRQDSKKETVDGVYNFVTVHAHNSLLKDENTPNEAIADFLARHHYEVGNYDMAAQYGEIVKNPGNYNKNFELFFIIEKNTFQKDLLQALQDLPPSLKPLCVTVVLIDNLKQIVKDTYDQAIASAIEYVYPEIV